MNKEDSLMHSHVELNLDKFNYCANKSIKLTKRDIQFIVTHAKEVSDYFVQYEHGHHIFLF